MRSQIVQPILLQCRATAAMKSSFFPRPGAPQFVREEASGQPNIQIVRFENTGHLIHRDQFDQFVTLVQGFFKQH